MNHSLTFFATAPLKTSSLNMNLYEQFTAYIEEEKLFEKQSRLLVAVSGGIDSVVLCRLCHGCGYSFTIAHCNFKLRGAESERDEMFVRKLAEQYGVPVLVKHFDTETLAEEWKLSVQVTARQLRYTWFEEVLEGDQQQAAQHENKSEFSRYQPLSHILTAHHADDNIETVMMNFFKGTGITGLRGILPRQGKLIRPLLFASREAIVQFARDEQLDFVVDSSNVSDKYTRNYFRNQLIPALEKVFPAAKENLSDNIQRFRETEVLYQQAIAAHKKKLLEYKESEVHIPVLKLKKLEAAETIIYEVLKPFGFSPHQAKEVLNLLDSETGRYVSSATHRVIRNRAWLIITPVKSASSLTILVETGEQKVSFEAGDIVLKTISAEGYVIKPQSDIAALDAESISFPLILRKWKRGDYFYPIGLRKKKKVSRFLTDLKRSLPQKEKTWVVEMNKKIIWIVNHRIDDRFKIMPGTKNILEIKFNSGS